MRQVLLASSLFLIELIGGEYTMETFILECDIFNKNGTLLLAKGREIELTQEANARLSRRGILDEVLAQLSEFKKRMICEETEKLNHIEDSERSKAQILTLGKGLYEKMQFTNEYSLDKPMNIVIDLINSQKSTTWHPHFLVLSNHINWIYEHSINVALISCIFGCELGYSYQQMIELGLGALLHDIGIIVLPRNVLNKTKELTGMEKAIMDNHSEIGYSLLLDSELSDISKNIILQHHETKNGTGYPNQLFDKDITEEVKIVMIAEALDTATTARPNQVARDIKVVLNEMLLDEEVYENYLVQILIKQTSLL